MFNMTQNRQNSGTEPDSFKKLTPLDIQSRFASIQDAQPLPVPGDRKQLEAEIFTAEKEEVEAAIVVANLVRTRRAQLLAAVNDMDARAAEAEQIAAQCEQQTQFVAKREKAVAGMREHAQNASENLALVHQWIATVNQAAKTLDRAMREFPRLAVVHDKEVWSFNNSQAGFSAPDRAEMKLEAGDLSAVQTRIGSGFNGLFWSALNPLAKELLMTLLQGDEGQFELNQLLIKSNSAIVNDWMDECTPPKLTARPRPPHDDIPAHLMCLPLGR